MTVTLYNPSEVPAGAETVKMDLGMLPPKLNGEIEELLKLVWGGTLPGPSVTSERVTGPMKPFKAPTLIVADLDPPSGTFREVSAGAK